MAGMWQPARFGRAFIVAAALLIGLGPSAAAERRMIVTPDTDYFGRDVGVEKDVTVEACEKLCIANTSCNAFTYNVKASWCFLKADFGDIRQFDGAISGRIVEGELAGPELEAVRRAELTFVGEEDFADVTRTLNIINNNTVDGTYAEVMAEATRHVAAGELLKARDRYKQGIRLAPERFEPWAALSETSFFAEGNTWELRDRLTLDSVTGAIAAYLRATDDAQRVNALQLLSKGYGKRQLFRQSIKALRLSLTITPDPVIADDLDALIAERGFRVVDTKVETDSDFPRVCVVFSENIADEQPNITDFVTVTGGEKLALEADNRQICASGVVFGGRYAMTVRQGLPAADGDEAIHKTSTFEFYVRDRDAAVRFVGRAYVLPRHADATIPVVTVNVDVIEARVVRVGDRNLAAVIEDGLLLSQMGSWRTENVELSSGEAIWSGEIEVTRDTNREVTSAIPVGEVVKDLEPGVYAMVARDLNSKEDWSDWATQWFIVSDLGLTTMTGNDGLHVVVRSLATAGPVAGANLRLVARNNEVLGTATVDAEGYARFDAGLVRGTGGNAPALLIAETAAGDYAFLDLTRAPFDLTDRGVEGRPAPLPVDVFLTTERGIYRPGETVHLTALMRDVAANAAPDLPMTLVVKRPDGAEHTRQTADDEGAGGRGIAVPLPDEAMRGAWRAQVFTDPKGPVLAETSFLVEDFLPERIDFSFDPGETPLEAGGYRDVPLEAAWLYGAPAANLTIEGEVYVTRAEGLPFAPTYRFGLEGEEFTPVAEPVEAAPTGEDGSSLVTLVVPDVQGVTAPLQAAVHIRVIDTNGRPVERRETMPITSLAPRLGIDPLFDLSVDEGSSAQFEIARFDETGARTAAADVEWTLSRVTTRYQWYLEDGYWNYEPITTTRRIGSGKVDLAADQPARIGAAVEWGEYLLQVEDPTGAAIPVSMSFYSGYYTPPSADPAPDLLKLTLDKPKYRVGETLTARIHPRFPGIAIVSVIDDRLIDMRVVEVGEDGGTVSLPVTGEWGPGAYVTAQLLRPLDLPAGRMPQRAIGLAWAGVDPGDRLLDVRLDVPAETRPRGPLEIAVSIPNAKPGEEAYVTLAAVDAGILNMTGFTPPAPEDWYFAQRRLGMSIRDLYGMLIDTTIGTRAAVRSGGDGAGISKLTGAPPTEKLVAFYQGVTRVGPDGTVRAAFDVPDFNGTVRVMAIAWSPTAVGHASADVLVRDPVVVQASLPNFLAPGDTSRLRLDITHVDGPSGIFSLSVTAAGDAVRIEPGFEARAVTLAEKGSAEVLVPIEALSVGDETITVDLAAADGTTLTKTLTLGVRANDPPLARTSEVTLAAGGRVTIGPDLLAGFVPGTGTATVTVGVVAGLDLPGIVRALDTYPYGCSEQITSRAMPLVYLDEVILAAGLTGDASVRERVDTAIGDVLVNQASNGSFGLWQARYENRDLWLDAYVTDFLTRAKEKGFEVPPVAFELAIINLRNQVSAAPEFSSGGEAVAYALYVLARNGRAAIGDLRYFADARLEAFSSPLAKAQIGAALALYGDNARADRVFRAALDMLAGETEKPAWRQDYGSRLRDGAAMLTLAAETGSRSVDLNLLARTVQQLGDKTRYASTQEQAWMLLAANALLADAHELPLSVDGQPHTGVFTARYEASRLDATPLVVENRGEVSTTARITAAGVPLDPEPAGGTGYVIERRFYGIDGAEIATDAVTLGQRIVVVLSVAVNPGAKRFARLMIDDPLPAGLVIDNPNLLTAADLTMLPWLSVTDKTARTEFRSDRFLSAVDIEADRETVTVSYMARAVAPGDYAYPAAMVMDMYRPDERGWTDSGRLVVAGPRR